MREIKLYGVNHALSYSTTFSQGVKEVALPTDLVEHLNLDGLSVIGLESTAEQAAFPRLIDDEYGISGLKGSQFFRDANSTLENIGASIAHLDDARLTRYVQPDLNGRIDRLVSKSIYNLDYFGFNDMRRLGFARTLFDFINTNLREELMYSKLKDSTANVVIIGQGHAEPLAASDELQDALGIRVVEYHRIEPDIDLANPQLSDIRPYEYGVSIDSRIVTPALSDIQTTAQSINLEKKISRRRFNAYSIGRVLGRRCVEPTYLGNFYIGSPAADSLFEMHILDRSGHDFSGIVYDVLGDATVQGSSKDDKIEFTKTYIPDRTISDGVVPIFYEGSSRTNDRTIEGRWDQTPEGVKFGYVFRMCNYEIGKLAIDTLDNVGSL